MTPSSISIRRTQENEKRKKKRGKKSSVARIIISKDTPVYKNSADVMAVDENKTELFRMIADSLVESYKDDECTVAVTRDESVVCNKIIDLENLSPCYKEEADDRIYLHANELSNLGFKKVTIVTVDTDVVVIGLYAFWHLHFDEIWIEFGTGKDKRLLPIHSYAESLGEEVCMALPFWYAFSGCDAVSQFLGRGKKTEWSKETHGVRLMDVLERLPICQI